MKKRLLSLTALICAVVMMLNVPGAYGTEGSYNDVNFSTYGNLNEGSDIPSLFRNDDVFTNYKDYPPVISDGVEYVPLELFYGLSGIKINYSDDNSNFYIQNKNTNQYISFNISDNYAVTGQNKVYETDVPSFYGVQYVPLRAVCDNTGIGCSTYNDGENRMYAIEVYTKDESLSAQDLLKIYAPEIYTPADNAQNDITNGNDAAAPDNGAVPGNDNMYGYDPSPSYPGYDPDNTHAHDINADTDHSDNNGKGDDRQNGAENNDRKPENPKPPRPKRGGTVMMFYLPDHFENADKTLDALEKLNVNAVFFVTEENILGSPDMIRKIYALGHTIGITFESIDEELYAEGVLEARTRSCEDALYEVAKIKTRLMYLGEDGKNDVISDDVRRRVEDMGLHTAVLNADARSDSLNPQRSADNARSMLDDIPATFGNDKVYLKLHHTDSGITAAGAAVGMSVTNELIKIELFDEAGAKVEK